MRERTAAQRLKGREVWAGWLGSFPRTLRCQAFRLRIPGTSGMNSKLSAGPSMSELCSKFQAPPPQFQRMNQQEKPGPAAWPREGAGGVAGLRAVSWGGRVCADTLSKGMAHARLRGQGSLALGFLHSQGKKNWGVGWGSNSKTFLGGMNFLVIFLSLGDQSNSV